MASPSTPKPKKSMFTEEARAKILKDRDQRLAAEEEKRKEFMKVRPGETPGNWAFRVRKYRPMTDNEILTMTGNTNEKRDLRNRVRIQKAKKVKSEKKRRRVQIHETHYDYLKYYLFVKKWASVKYSILPEDLEIGLCLYDNLPFTREQFYNRFKAVTKPFGAFKRFYDLGYTRKVMAQTRKTGAGKSKNGMVQTFEYTLTKEFRKKLTEFYKVLEGDRLAKNKTVDKKKIDENIERVIMEMRNEMDEISRGQKSSDSVAYRNDYEEEN